MHLNAISKLFRMFILKKNKLLRSQVYKVKNHNNKETKHGHCKRGMRGITIHELHAPLKKVIRIIEKKSGYRLVYRKRTLKNSRLVNVSLKKASLEEALDLCFKGQPYVYVIRGKKVFINRVEAPVKNWFTLFLFFREKYIKVRFRLGPKTIKRLIITILLLLLC